MVYEMNRKKFGDLVVENVPHAFVGGEYISDKITNCLTIEVVTGLISVFNKFAPGQSASYQQTSFGLQ